MLFKMLLLNAIIHLLKSKLYIYKKSLISDQKRPASIPLTGIFCSKVIQKKMTGLNTLDYRQEIAGWGGRYRDNEDNQKKCK